MKRSAGSTKRASKRQKVSRQEKEKETLEWPEYFHDLFKVCQSNQPVSSDSFRIFMLLQIFKALNTVLAFVSSRRHLATTFPMIRSSAEGLLKRPLELSKVAELKALLPDVVEFAYIPHSDLRIHGETVSQQNKRPNSPDFTLHSQSLAIDTPSGSRLPGHEEEEHVLVLEFAENFRTTKLGNLVDKRNQRFKDAVDELVKATPEAEVSMDLLQAAARDHIPVNPSAKKALPVNDSQNLIIPEPKDRPSIDDILLEIRKQHWYKNQIADRRTFKEKVATEGLLDEPLSHTIQQALRESRNITTLYYHQAAAINAIAQRKHVIVSTSTASGKSVIYQALAQDQRTALEQLLWACPGLQHIKVATYDGDTPQDHRRTIRETASVIFTNFDMLHASILPHEEFWRTFIKNLKLVAVDELHYYSNLFGSHVAQIIRRFRRICAAVGNQRVIFVSCSATISKPSQHMKRLFGVEDVEEIVEDGAPSGKKDYLVWDPPSVKDMDPGLAKLGQSGPMYEAINLMIFLMMRGVRVILFCKIRRACELAMKALRQRLSAEGRLDVLAKVMPYRGVLRDSQDRRRIEHEAFSGHLLGIVATNALELGVDIGVLDAVIMLGFPFGIANFRQQAGRAGRRSRDSLAVLVAEDLPIDRNYVESPDKLYNQPIDDLTVDIESKVIIEAHLQCAAHEMPLSKDDAFYFGASLGELCDSKLRKDKDGWYHPHPKFLPYPAKHISIRGADDDKYTIIDVTKVGLQNGVPRIIEEIELSRAIFELYEGGVFMHQGLTFIVKEVSHDTKVARLVRADVNWITKPRCVHIPFSCHGNSRRHTAETTRKYFLVVIQSTTLTGPTGIFYSVGFRKIRGNKVLDVVDVDTPPYERQVTGFWFDVPKDLLGLMKVKHFNFAEAIHSASHAWMNRFALSPDLRTECKAAEKEYNKEESQRKRPARLIFYDASRKGSVSAQAFDHSGEVLRQAHDTVETCPCKDGCIHSATCSKGNVVASKIGALLILKALLNLDIDANGVAAQFGSQGFETIVEAMYIRPLDGVQVEPA
ncbi:DEAD H helicase [Suillus subalutaceus]|uniref:DEAD H helicase n=1 Tax=Suillus subalutaceus TaxID=48586 RepID=UPI001B882DE9|nr:DEAD H helicase [Suillus subalutaceus]KAG1858378.1 DEAD H helicase [Suillus subalutaceus]